ncbi:MAG: hypothetical protein KY459_13900 [Acidobacteria bacterium]|nr:hypothetical protein [Acidobacteriota bacterium]
MILELYPPPANERVVLAENATREDVVSAIFDRDWNEITFVVLKADDDDWFEISGSIQPFDGLSARVMESGEEKVSARAPRSLEEAAALMTSYLEGDNHWRVKIPWVD